MVQPNYGGPWIQLGIWHKIKNNPATHKEIVKKLASWPWHSVEGNKKLSPENSQLGRIGLRPNFMIPVWSEKLQVRNLQFLYYHCASLPMEVNSILTDKIQPPSRPQRLPTGKDATKNGQLPLRGHKTHGNNEKPVGVTNERNRPPETSDIGIITWNIK